jgi:hypothetical protein
VVQQSACSSSPHTAAAHVLHVAESASPATCSLCAQRGTRTTPFRISVAGAAGPFAVLSSTAYTYTSPD